MLKVRIMYWWWIFKYGGKKKIPPEVIFEQLEKTMASLTQDIKNAIKVSPDDMCEEERLLARAVMLKTVALESEIKKITSEG